MPTFEQGIEIDALPDALFRLTQDYDRRLDWDPFLKAARLVGGATAAGKGVRAYCVARNGMGMETEYVSFKPPHVCAVKMTSGPRLMHAFAGSWRFKPVSPTRTQVIFRYHIEAAPRFMAALFDPILCAIFSHEVGKRLKALKLSAETTDILLRDQPVLASGA